MCDPSSVTAKLTSIIDCLDPKQADVAICHLHDAIAAIEAVGAGRATKYARTERLQNGAVASSGRITPFR